MIETTKESDYLRNLAAWFDKMGKVRQFTAGTDSASEVARHLERIAEKLRLLEAHDHMITAKNPSLDSMIDAIFDFGKKEFDGNRYNVFFAESNEFIKKIKKLQSDV